MTGWTLFSSCSRSRSEGTDIEGDQGVQELPAVTSARPSFSRHIALEHSGLPYEPVRVERGNQSGDIRNEGVCQWGSFTSLRLGVSQSRAQSLVRALQDGPLEKTSRLWLSVAKSRNSAASASSVRSFSRLACRPFTVAQPRVNLGGCSSVDDSQPSI